MTINTDESFSGEEGMIRVWNPTPNFVQVTEEGHLLQSFTSAWVDENPVLVALIEEGMVVVVEGATDKTPKKVTKARAKASDPSPSEDSQVHPVAQQSDDKTQTLDSIVLDSSPLSDNTDSVSVENI